MIKRRIQGEIKKGSSLRLDLCTANLDWSWCSHLNLTDFNCATSAVACRVLVLRKKECQAIALSVPIAAAIFLFVHLASVVSDTAPGSASALDTEPIAGKQIISMHQVPRGDSTIEIVIENLERIKALSKKA